MVYNYIRIRIFLHTTVLSHIFFVFCNILLKKTSYQLSSLPLFLEYCFFLRYWLYIKYVYWVSFNKTNSINQLIFNIYRPKSQAFFSINTKYGFLNFTVGIILMKIRRYKKSLRRSSTCFTILSKYLFLKFFKNKSMFSSWRIIFRLCGYERYIHILFLSLSKLLKCFHSIAVTILYNFGNSYKSRKKVRSIKRNLLKRLVVDNKLDRV